MDLDGPAVCNFVYVFFNIFFSFLLFFSFQIDTFFEPPCLCYSDLWVGLCSNIAGLVTF